MFWLLIRILQVFKWWSEQTLFVFNTSLIKTI